MTTEPTIYITYIAATAEKIWAALTSGELSKQYFFGRRVESDWKPGSQWKLWMGDTLDVTGQVLKAEPPRLLSVTWQVEMCVGGRKLPAAIVTYRIDSL